MNIWTNRTRSIRIVLCQDIQIKHRSIESNPVDKTSSVFCDLTFSNIRACKAKVSRGFLLLWESRETFDLQMKRGLSEMSASLLPDPGAATSSNPVLFPHSGGGQNEFNDHEALQTLFSDPEVQQKLRDIQAKRAPKIDKDEIIDMVARASAQATAKAMVDFKQSVTDELAASIVKAWNKDSEEGHPPPGLESKHRYDKPVSSHDIVEGTLPNGEKIDHWVPKYKIMYDRPMVPQQRIANDSIRAGELSWIPPKLGSKYAIMLSSGSYTEIRQRFWHKR